MSGYRSLSYKIGAVGIWSAVILWWVGTIYAFLWAFSKTYMKQ